MPKAHVNAEITPALHGLIIWRLLMVLRRDFSWYVGALRWTKSKGRAPENAWNWA